MTDFETMPLGTRAAIRETAELLRSYEQHHQARANNDALTIRWRNDNRKFQDQNPETERTRADSEAKARRNGDAAARLEALLK